MAMGFLERHTKLCFAVAIGSIVLYVLYMYMPWPLRNTNIKDLSLLQDISKISSGSSVCKSYQNSDENRECLKSRYEENINWSLKFTEKPFRAYFVHDQGHLLERISHYNQAIQRLRDIWSDRKDSEWQDISKPLTVVLGSHDDYFTNLSNYTHITTVILPWKGSTDHNNGKMKSPSLQDWDGVYNKTCVVDLEASKSVISLEPLYLHGKPINRYYCPNNGDRYPDHFYTSVPAHVYYLHFVEDSIITENGNIYSRNLQLMPYGCIGGNRYEPNYEDSNVDYTNTLIYREVFIMSQYWCDQFFHKMLECLPRIAPYLEFLKSNKDILIHVSETNGATAELLGYLGISQERLITGLCRTHVAFMPQATPCGFPVPTETQILSSRLKKAFKKKYPDRYSNRTRNHLVLISRCCRRRFLYQKPIEKLMINVAKDYNLTFRLFPDNPVPPREIAMEYFNGAKVIVAPHGAGLANMLFSEPGTLIVEGVCNPPHVNMCFQWTAHGLGMRYHGIPSKRGCENVIDIEPAKLDSVVRSYLDLLRDDW